MSEIKNLRSSGASPTYSVLIGAVDRRFNHYGIGKVVRAIGGRVRSPVFNVAYHRIGGSIKNSISSIMEMDPSKHEISD